METTNDSEEWSSYQLNNNADTILDVTTVDEEEKIEEETLWDNLPTELIISIFKYLPHSDLQQSRLVCKRWHHITELPQFMDKSKLIITKENLNYIYLSLRYDVLFSRLSYNTLELHQLQRTHRLLMILNSLGPNIRNLCLYKSPISAIVDVDLPDLEDLNLKYASPDIDNHFPIDLRKFKKLKSLDFGSRYADAFAIVERCIPMKMEKLCFHFYQRSEGVANILRKNANSLKYLELTIHSAPIMSYKWKEAFTSLRQLESLKIFGCYHYPWLEAIIECLPKETPLRYYSINGISTIMDCFLLNLVIDKFAETLEKVDILFFDLRDFDVERLRILRNLQSLNIFRCKKVSHLALLGAVASQKNNILNSLTLDSSIEEVHPLYMKIFYQRLPQLTYLNLRNCKFFVNDNALEYIFLYQRKLQHLILDECTLITDKPIVGHGYYNTSIRDLKGLQTLSLMGCTKLSDRALIFGLKFNELRKLVLGYSKGITSLGIRELVKNCPTLENLTISSCLNICDDAMLYIGQGLLRLRCLKVNNCNQVTCKSIAHLVEICKCLQEISIYGIDYAESEVVVEKCIKARPKIIKFNY